MNCSSHATADIKLRCLCEGNDPEAEILMKKISQQNPSPDHCHADEKELTFFQKSITEGFHGIYFYCPC